MSDDETGRRCASPFCGRPIASGERAIVASASWTSATAVLCGWSCLAAWTSLMAIAQRAADHRELYGVRRRDGQAEASV
jgi:hypothetical protein